MLDKCPMPRRRNSFMNSFLILLCLLFSLVSKSALQIQYFRYVFSSTISEGRLSQLQQRKWFHLALPSFSFSKLNGHRCSWMTISWVHFTLSTSNRTHYGFNTCFVYFFPVDGCLLCHCIQAFASSVFCEFVYWLLDNFSCFHSAASYIVNAVKGGILVLWMELWERRRDLIAEYKSSEFLNA